MKNIQCYSYKRGITFAKAHKSIFPDLIIKSFLSHLFSPDNSVSVYYKWSSFQEKTTPAMFKNPDKTLIRYLLDNYIHLVQVENKKEYARLRNKYPDDTRSNRQKRDDLALFEKRMAEKILQEYPYDVIVNKCPCCQQLARTPFARQCPHCFYSWHGHSASFKINHSIRLTGRGFYIIGKHVSGTIKPGMKIDFDQIGIANTGVIRAFEFVRGPRGLKNVEETGLEIEGLTEREEKEISLNCPYLIPVPVLK